LKDIGALLDFKLNKLHKKVNHKNFYSVFLTAAGYTRKAFYTPRPTPWPIFFALSDCKS